MDKDLAIKIGQGKAIEKSEHNLEQKPFVSYNEKKVAKTFTIRITEDLEEWFLEAKKLIRQPKNSTALKQLAKMGYLFVLHDEKIKGVLNEVLENSRRNQRMGITEGEYSLDK